MGDNLVPNDEGSDAESAMESEVNLESNAELESFSSTNDAWPEAGNRLLLIDGEAMNSDSEAQVIPDPVSTPSNARVIQEVTFAEIHVDLDYLEADLNMINTWQIEQLEAMEFQQLIQIFIQFQHYDLQQYPYTNLLENN